LRNEGAGRCLTNRHVIVAVRDGVLIRTRKAEAATLLINGRNEHLRFRYMHMHLAHGCRWRAERPPRRQFLRRKLRSDVA
jgi:hypothetical protein